ncbi:2-dehydro-3-deoxygluconokinase [Botrimarina colliarenosi]|uniref:2-dehydro-3-deoxygluconokinase n=1 Tax=Botrimarina colliarenosi TaxID=2528001 RepID=A0A5C6AI35_9BACT|nr:PfkB family carbohydrate kinase [Botrimarina colliarenosi]TWT99147.1 2-dehydro-3-deoxygluconokinase [Botrimarina colliarenosi]
MPAAKDSRSAPLIVGLGEALFDCFEDKQVLGGAPLNVAIHADALLRPHGGSAVTATRVGSDPLGDEVVRTLQQRKVATDWVQRDANSPTGRVQVTLDEQGVASYVFEKNSAWDAIEFTPAFDELAGRCDAVAFGTLCQRSETSRQTIQKFLAAASGAVRLFDVNLRQDYYSTDLLRDSLRLANAAKVNEEELAILDERLLGGAGGERPMPGVAADLREKFALEWVAVTRGPQGAALMNADGWIEGEQPAALEEADANRDTVGAGDACCAGLLTGTLLGWPAARTLSLANAMGSFVASRSGATPELPQRIIDIVQAV